MKLTIIAALTLYLNITGSDAVVKRHDINPEKYQVTKTPSYLINMPHEGHGVLIQPNWVITVAHTIFYNYKGKILNIDGKDYIIEKVFIHPGYETPKKQLLKGDAKPLMQFFESRSDIALIKLSSSVESHITPISIYPEDNILGEMLTIFGGGAKGDGKKGENLDSKFMRKIEKFQNEIEELKNNWLTFIFNKPPKGLKLEGTLGSGDSGGPAVIAKNGIHYVVGLSSWQYWHGDLSTFKGGLYGTKVFLVRLSSYKNWIKTIINN